MPPRHHEKRRQRFIPACAGNSGRSSSPACTGPVHPRVRGEQSSQIDVSSNLIGSSPRARGTAYLETIVRQGTRFIPACAGNSSARSTASIRASVHPRVRGEQMACTSSSVASVGSSPRARGTDHGPRPAARQIRFIPACAGNSRKPRKAPMLAAVHPRVRGEQLPCRKKE